MTPQPKLILLDADGVLWRGGQVIAEAPGFIRRAQAAGIRCVLVSNNAGPDRAAYLQKCEGLGLALSEADIFSVNYIAGSWLARHYPGARVLVLGSEMLAASVARHMPDCESGLSWLQRHALDQPLLKAEELARLRDADFDVVLCGIDINVSYAKLALASVVLERGAKLVAANHDPTFPFEDGMVLPGNGSIVELLSRVAGVDFVSLGKPGLAILEQIEAECAVERSQMLMIGDRIDTDIRLALNAGMPSILVLTGVSSRADAAGLPASVSVAENLDAAADWLGF